MSVDSVIYGFADGSRGVPVGECLNLILRFPLLVFCRPFSCQKRPDFPAQEHGVCVSLHHLREIHYISGICHSVSGRFSAFETLNSRNP